MTEKDIPRLLRQLKKHASKWREIGVNLEFLPGELSNIAAHPNLSEGAPVSFLGALLEEWMQWAPGDSRHSIDFATFESLKTALSDSGLGAAAHDLVVRMQEPTLRAGLKSDSDSSGSTVAVNKKLTFRFHSTMVERCVLSKKNEPETIIRLFGIRYDTRMQICTYVDVYVTYTL